MVRGAITNDTNPWPVISPILEGRCQPPQSVYAADVAVVAKTWTALTDDQRALLHLLSRFALSPAQAKRWFDRRMRQGTVRAPVDKLQISRIRTASPNSTLATPRSIR